MSDRRTIDPLAEPSLRALGLNAEALRAQRPLYRALATALETALVKGAIVPGQRLPPERSLAAWLKVSRTTVVEAYRELESRGWLRGYVGRGTFAAAVPEFDGAPFAWRGKIAAAGMRSGHSPLRTLMREATEPGLLSVGAGTPALDIFPVEAFTAAFERVMARHGTAVWGHGPTEGQAVLRERLARRHGCDPDRVLILAGAQQGLDLLARCLVDPGDTVIVDRPGYVGAIHSFQEAGARVHGWDVTRADIDELEDMLLRYRPKLIYTNPTFQNPTGWTMSRRVRREFLRVASQYRVPVVEDDTYRGLSFAGAPPPTLQSLDEQSIVIYLSSFSKVLAPGLRLGWIVAAPAIVDHLALIKQRADPQTQNLAQFVVADLLDSGAFDAHVTDLRAEHRRRSQALALAIQRTIDPADLRITVMPSGGLYFWCRLGQNLDATVLRERARAERVSFVPGAAFYTDGAGARELRVCFSTVTVANAAACAQGLAVAIEAQLRAQPVRETRRAKA